MKLLNTEAILTLCENDIKSADLALNTLNRYQNGEVSLLALQEQIMTALSDFKNNSNKFEQPVERTTNFVAKATIWLIILCSLIVLSITLFISISVSRVLTKREETMKALAQSEEHDRQLAYLDTLTGLPNRNILEDNITHAISNASRNHSIFAVMFIDLDQFKDINDTLGHTIGDKLLVKMANRISLAMRDNDLVVRFGGDEFVAIIDCFDSVETIDCVATRIIETIRKPVRLADSEILITASIGIACYPENGKDPTSLLKHADTALYQAKSAGKNQFQPYDSLSASIQNRKLKIAKQLRNAIKNNEFSLVYQPIVQLSSGRTVGSEALIRWTNAENETIGPDEFIPVAEHSGQIIEIGNWVLQKACEQCKTWHSAGTMKHIMAINVSSFQLKAPFFAKGLSDILTSLSLPAECIHIEITENIAITEDKMSVSALYEISDLGIKLLLDDFGTGYSCLSYLKNLPFDILKIDRSFMPANNTIASTIIAMGHELKMEIIAEGIETLDCYRFLNKLNCQYGQGYLFQKPVPPSKFDIFRQFNQEVLACTLPNH
ncbi:EAL domain-containing protein [Paraglaciecola aquimarina]|uniref:EAL domain-containing protein n=1 Tax=Paraglaciecola algarum TaxID=3050085 RepID=A0ABS9D6H1_9ALTE|nr:EAL domain-containing protein [Paraglaciecola sp. G1-23]MCF2948528.1 EAL domain-containing protein [Paraglaciecola sp. G1-23]